MTADVTAQAWAVVQAIGLGLAAGLLYDCLLYTSDAADE